MFLVKFIKKDDYKEFYKNLPSKEIKKSYKKYINEITNRLTIISPEKYLNRKKIRINFDVNNQGDTENIKIIEPSDSKVFDDKIIKQIKELNIFPYPSDLQNFKIKKINVEYKIETNLLNNSMYYPLFIPLYY
jgi:TonB family protein